MYAFLNIDLILGLLNFLFKLKSLLKVMNNKFFIEHEKEFTI